MLAGEGIELVDGTVGEVVSALGSGHEVVGETARPAGEWGWEKKSSMMDVGCAMGAVA